MYFENLFEERAPFAWSRFAVFLSSITENLLKCAFLPLRVC